MKYVFIEKHRAEFSIKVMCWVLRGGRSGWYAWCLRRHQINPRQQFLLVCDNAVREAFDGAKQRILITTFEKPKITPFHLLKISPLIRTASKCIKRAGDSKEESPISSLVSSNCGATLNTAFEEPKLTPFWFKKMPKARS